MLPNTPDLPVKYWGLLLGYSAPEVKGGLGWPRLDRLDSVRQQA